MLPSPNLAASCQAALQLGVLRTQGAPATCSIPNCEREKQFPTPAWDVPNNRRKFGVASSGPGARGVAIYSWDPGLASRSKLATCTFPLSIKRFQPDSQPVIVAIMQSALVCNSSALGLGSRARISRSFKTSPARSVRVCRFSKGPVAFKEDDSLMDVSAKWRRTPNLLPLPLMNHWL